LLPDLVIGKYLKIELVGKPVPQATIDNKYYIALQKVSANGCSINSDNIPQDIRPTIEHIGQEVFQSEIKRVKEQLGIDVDTQDKLDENLSEEDVEFFKNSLESLINGDIVLSKFMEDNNISNIYDWVERYRFGFLKSETVFNLIKNEAELDLSISFFRDNSIINSNTKTVSFVKLILVYLYQMSKKYGFLDRTNSEIYFKLLNCSNNIQSFKIMLRLGRICEMNCIKMGDDLIEKYFSYNIKEEIKDETEDKPQSNSTDTILTNKNKLLALRYIGLHRDAYIFECMNPNIDEEK
jgi:hypothetical protein